MGIQKVMVIGAGQMGSGIAQVCAQAGFDVKLNDIKQEFFERGLGVITKNLSRDVEKGRKTEDEKAAVLSRISMSLDLQDASDVDIIIEAAVENMEIKQSIFKQLDGIAPAHAILATNTSSLPITEIAAEVYKAVEEMTVKLSKTPVEVNDFPGFISNRILLPMINEAIYALYEGVATKEAIDDVMKLGMNHPMGPLTLADFIGLDTCLYIMEILHEGLGDSKYRPCPLLRKYVAAGWLGKKSGRGFYVYE